MCGMKECMSDCMNECMNECSSNQVSGFWNEDLNERHWNNYNWWMNECKWMKNVLD